MAPKRRRRSPRQRRRRSQDDTKEAPKRKRACQRQHRSQDVVEPKNDARKQLLLDSVKGQSRRITRQNVSNTKQKISQMSDRELRMIQRTKRISTPSPSKHSTNIATDGSIGTDKTDNSDEIVPSTVESPKTNDAPSFSSRQSNETTSKNVP